MNSSYSDGPSQREQAELASMLKRLTNERLREVLKSEGLPVSGVKGVLTARIIDRIQTIVRERDPEAFTKIAQAIDQTRRYHFVASKSATTHYSSSPPHSYSMPHNGYPTASHHTSIARGSGAFNCPFQYKKSPFYEVKETLSNTLEFKKLEQNRETLNLPLILSDNTINKLTADKSLRIMLYCAGEVRYDQLPGAPRDIAFPQNIEVRINGEEFKTNMKGIKNKPGTTKPADITAFVRTKTANYKNTITVLYALTKEKYYMNVMLVKKNSVQQLTDLVRSGKFISKQQVLNEMKSKASDPDIVATSTVLSLKDPISYLRLTNPCRSTLCTHVQCFEVNFFLELQEQAPQWTCPICSKLIPFETIAIDQYVQDILQKTSSNTDQVTLEPDGQWRMTVSDDASKFGAGDDDDDDSDDLVEVSNSRNPVLKTEIPATPFSFSTNTPPVASPAPSLRPQPSGGAGSKRRSEVIDLTLSDEDETPAPKRPALTTPSNQANGYHPTNAIRGQSLTTHNPFSPQTTSNSTFNPSFPPFGVQSPSRIQQNVPNPSRSAFGTTNAYMPTSPPLPLHAPGTGSRHPTQHSWARSSPSFSSNGTSGGAGGR